MCSQRLLSAAIIALLCVGARSGFAQEHPCDPQVPVPPDPIPPNFDWTPLARDWCGQLADCGFNTSTCVDDYLAAIRDGVPAGGTLPPEGIDEASASDMLRCEDSDEFAAGLVNCNCGDQTC